MRVVDLEQVPREEWRAGVKTRMSAANAILHILSTLAAPVFEAAYDDKRETPRRWLPS